MKSHVYAEAYARGREDERKAIVDYFRGIATAVLSRPEDADLHDAARGLIAAVEQIANIEARVLIPLAGEIEERAEPSGRARAPSMSCPVPDPIRIPHDPVPVPEPTDDPHLAAIDAALAEDAITRDLSDDLEDIDAEGGES